MSVPNSCLLLYVFSSSTRKAELLAASITDDNIPFSVEGGMAALPFNSYPFSVAGVLEFSLQSSFFSFPAPIKISVFAEISQTTRPE